MALPAGTSVQGGLATTPDGALYVSSTVGAVSSKTAAGSSQGTATPITYGFNRITGGFAGGVILPAATGTGKSVFVSNEQGFFNTVYPQPGESIQLFAANVGYAQAPITVIEYIDVGTGLWEFLSNLPFHYPTFNTVTAFAGGGQGSATTLGWGTNVVRTCATDLDSVQLPLAIGGCYDTFVINMTTKIVNVFPNATAGQNFINDLAANTPIQLPPGCVAFFVDIGPSNNQWVGGIIAHPAKQTTEAPLTVTTATYSPAVSDANVIFNAAGTCTVTLPAAASFRGKTMRFRTIAAQLVVSNASNVVPLVGGAAGTAILAATAGKWADITSDGTNWQLMAGN